MAMLQIIQRDLKELIGQDRYDELFLRLKKEVLREDCELYNQVILIQSRYNQGLKVGNLGLIDFKEKDLTFNNVSHALMWLTDQITEADLSPTLRLQAKQHVFIPDYHTFTCDRTEQSGMVQLQYYENPARKIRHFYLHGDARQAMKSLYKRLGYELGGSLLNWADNNYAPSQKVKFIACKPQFHQMHKLFHLNIIRELLAQFHLQATQDILQQKITHVLDSKILNGNTPEESYGANDFIFILLTLDQHNWRENVTPLVVKNFIEGFCACELPPEAPEFFFFYGVEYLKDDSAVRDSVQSFIEKAELGEKLNVLSPVSLADVAEWFSRYDILLPKDTSAEQMATRLFPGLEHIDMKDIETKLLEITDRHNKGYVPDIV